MNTQEQTLKYAMRIYQPSELQICYSGGRDSSATIHATLNALKELQTKIPIKLHYWNTDINAPENVEHVHTTANKLGLELIEIKPEKHFNHESLYERFGFLSAGGHRYSLGFLKWFGFRKYAKIHAIDNILYITGRRLLESNARTTMVSNEPYSKVESNINMCSPLFYWDNDYTRNYLKNNNIAVSPCYDTIGTDGNCQCGTMASSDELKMISIFHKPLFEKIAKIDDRLGGIREVKFVLDIEKCPYCESIQLRKGKNRFIDGEHSYIYYCLRCKAKIIIPDYKMPYELGLKDMGHWGNGVNPPANELMNIPDIACHGCIQYYLEKHHLQTITDNKSRPIIPQKYYDKVYGIK